MRHVVTECYLTMTHGKGVNGNRVRHVRNEGVILERSQSLKIVCNGNITYFLSFVCVW